VHFGIAVFWGSIAVQATLMGENEMLGVGCLQKQPSQAFDDVRTPVYAMVLLIVNAYHIFQSV